MTFNYELAASNNSHCSRCERRIPRGCPRGYLEGVVNNHPTKSHYCLACVNFFLKRELREFKKWNKKLNQYKTTPKWKEFVKMLKKEQVVEVLTK